MDPVRRALFLLLFASVVLTEPTQVRALTKADRAAAPAPATTHWISYRIQRLAVALRRTVEPAAVPPSWHCYRPALIAPTPVASQVIAAHPAREAHAFRLPPPLSEG